MSLQANLDRYAVGLSLLCAVHCLVLPVTATLMPTFVSFSLDGEAFHQWLLIVITPLSLMALTMGCRNHKRYRVYLYGVVGLFILGLASYLGHQHLGELEEKIMTLLGGIIIAIGHVKNYRLCQTCKCDSSSIQES